MDALIADAWNEYNSFQQHDFVVKPSIPILFFGDSKQYEQSKLRVVTVGLNPSKGEFHDPGDPDPFVRFEDARNVYPGFLDGGEQHYSSYLSALNNYFRNKPYDWFRYSPYYIARGEQEGGQNTDPFVFGDQFYYSCCRQHTKAAAPSQLQRLQVGSVLLFGSCVGKRTFVLDTVFVVDHYDDFNLNMPKARERNRLIDPRAEPRRYIDLVKPLNPPQ